MFSFNTYIALLFSGLAVENPGSDNLKSSTVVPPPTVIDRVLKELFHEGIKLPPPRRLGLFFDVQHMNMLWSSRQKEKKYMNMLITTSMKILTNCIFQILLWYKWSVIFICPFYDSHLGFGLLENFHYN